MNPAARPPATPTRARARQQNTVHKQDARRQSSYTEHEHIGERAQRDDTCATGSFGVSSCATAASAAARLLSSSSQSRSRADSYTVTVTHHSCLSRWTHTGLWHSAPFFAAAGWIRTTFALSAILSATTVG